MFREGCHCKNTTGLRRRTRRRPIGPAVATPTGPHRRSSRRGAHRLAQVTSAELSREPFTLALIGNTRFTRALENSGFCDRRRSRRRSHSSLRPTVRRPFSRFPVSCESTQKVPLDSHVRAPDPGQSLWIELSIHLTWPSAFRLAGVSPGVEPLIAKVLGQRRSAQSFRKFNRGQHGPTSCEETPPTEPGKPASAELERPN